MTLPETKTKRLLRSFSAVEIKPEHRNYGDEGPALRDFGVAPSVATALIRWGEQHDLVCRFENQHGRTNNAYSWKSGFLLAAVASHLEYYGDAGSGDFPPCLLAFAEREQLRASLIGLREGAAAERLRECGFVAAIALRDGASPSPFSSADIRRDRAKLVVEDGVVARVAFG